MLLDVAVQLHVLILGSHSNGVQQVFGQLMNCFDLLRRTLARFEHFTQSRQSRLHVLLLLVPINVTLVELLECFKDRLQDPITNF